MALIMNAGRQNLLYAVQEVDLATLGASGDFDAVELPAGAMFVSGALSVAVASDDSSTATLSIGVKGGAVDAYLAATNVKAIADTAITGGSLAPLAVKTTLTVTPAFAGDDATVGTAYVVVAYVIAGRATEAQ
jgi:hypothetical protein